MPLVRHFLDKLLSPIVADSAILRVLSETTVSVLRKPIDAHPSGIFVHQASRLTNW